MNTRFLSVLAAFSIIVASSTSIIAAAPEDTYLATRDKAVERIKKLRGDAAAKLESQTLAELERQLRALIGPKRFNGLPTDGKITLETLNDGVGLGLLDGLSFDNEDQSRRIIVTTQSLTAAWLKAHKSWTPERPLPDTLQEAVKTEEFLTQAFGTGAAFVLYGALPVASRSGFVHASLFALSQDGSPSKPESIIIVAVKGDRVFASQTKLLAPVEPIAICDKLKDKLDLQAQALLKRYNATGSKNQKLFDDYVRLQAQTEVEFKGCFIKNAGSQPWFKTVVLEAQSLSDGLTE